MKIKNKLLVSTIFSIGLLNSHSIYAAGFSTDLHSASGIGNSYAGSVNGNHDISDSFTNPAVLQNVKTNEIFLSGSQLSLDIDSDNSVATNGGPVSGVDNRDAGVDTFIPSFFVGSRVNDKSVFGISVTIPFGLATKYSDEWVGRYHAVESDIQTVNLNPAISYAVNDQFSVGFGLQAQYMKAVLSKYVFTTGSDHYAKLKGDDWGYGYNLGAKYQLNDSASIGMAYRSHIDHKLKGNGEVKTLNIADDFSAKLSTPETFVVGASYDLTDKLELLTDFQWVRWSRVKEIDVVSKTAAFDNDDLKIKFQNSRKYSLGVNYKLNDQYKVRTGLAYEQGANSSDEYRSPRLPTGERIWTSLGFEYKINEAAKVDFGYLHQFHKTTSSKIESPAAPAGAANLESKYKTNVDVFAISFDWQF